MGDLLQDLRRAVGSAQVLVDRADVEGYAVDWTGAFRGAPRAVVRPGSADEVAEVLAACVRHGAPVVPQGGNTGLVGGGVPLAGEVVLSSRRLVGEPEVDTAAAQLLVAAGTPLELVQRAAARAGLGYGVDTASRGSATIGGTIATNAGGLRVMRYGDTRAQLVGLEAVLGTGAVVRRLSGITRDNSGYPLPSLLAGSEGTLGFMTRALLRLWPAPAGRALGLLTFADAGSAVAAAQVARRASTDLSAIELTLRPGLDLVARVSGRALPIGGSFAAALVVEVTAPAAEAVLADLAGSLPGVLDGAVAADRAGIERLWQWREGHTEAINTVGPPVKMDVTLPAGQVARFLAEVPDVVRAVVPDAAVWLFGHVGDGNVHVNVTGAAGRADAVQDAAFTDVAGRGGSISTEHGIGTAKRRWLHLVRSPEEIAAYRAVKHALDPHDILNPNAVLPRATHPHALP